MIKRVVILILLFYFLVLIQTSFLVHFSFLNIVSNLVLIIVIFINLFELPERKFGIVSSLIGGFYLDIFSLSSAWFFGFYTLLLLLIAAIIKFIFKRYVQIPSIKQL